ncbi:protein CYSTEINE-RICH TRANSMEMBRANE MODULE 6-like isoform X1 [Magnolia sinica]|uniref:protein CYSTEINE-RICH TRANSMEMBRANE MODULE 6-like isoform X1 n=1 Tax=Magnolia sinica TaxID=86752 RepID=UPI00265831B8|nr:protein CYSTEINE-RICH TRANSMEMBRANE MODULE 6-like isoform X1 [Magnolia sinica]
MSHYEQHQGPQIYPPPATAYPPPGQAYPPQSYPGTAYVAAPPPMGYPTNEGSGYPQQHVPVETKSRGDGFWKGCCAALRCCCVLDACF